MAESAVMTILLAECASGKATGRSLAVLYALMIACPAAHGGDWRRINEAVNAALRLDTASKIDRFRQMAWRLYDQAVEQHQSRCATTAAQTHDAPGAVQ